jgi:activator of HSP90 ATPase
MSISRREFAATFAASAATLTVPSHILSAVEPQNELGISHTADSIHQEAFFKIAPDRVYAALTDAKQFDNVFALSDAAKTMKLADNPSVISKQPGGAFALFGGYITGRHVESVENKRLVQAWRSGSWKVGAYSIVTWTFTPTGTGTTLSMDHGGFPTGEAQTLATGWHKNYITPLLKYLSS